MSHTEFVNPDVQLDDPDSSAMMDDFAASMTNTFDSSIDAAQIKYQQARLRHWNEVARKLETWTGWGGYYHRRLTQVYQSLVAPGQSVLELGCARGDLLAALKPALGVGVDFSEEMIRAARRRHPHLRFVHADAHALNLSEKFDVIILSDLVNDLWDVQTVLKNVCQLTALLAAGSSSILTAAYGSQF